MIKARVSKNLKGSIMLPTVGPKAFTANNEVFMTEEQLYAADIQGALSKKLLIMLDGPSQKDVKFTNVTNLSFGSVSLPGANVVLRAGKSCEVRSDVLDTPVYRKMVKDGLIALDLKLKTGAPKAEKIGDAEIKRDAKGKPKTRKLIAMEEVDEEADPIIPANMQIGRPITMQQSIDKSGRAVAKANRADLPKQTKQAAKKGTPDKQKKHGIKRVEAESLIYDPDAVVDEDGSDFLIDPRTGKTVAGDDGIIFVDHEQSQARMNPRLKGRK